MKRLIEHNSMSAGGTPDIMSHGTDISLDRLRMWVGLYGFKSLVRHWLLKKRRHRIMASINVPVDIGAESSYSMPPIKATIDDNNACRRARQLKIELPETEPRELSSIEKEK
jgi:hypothetical protein